MKIRIDYLFPEFFTYRDSDHRILDLRAQSAFTFERLEYPEGVNYHMVIQILGFGICVNIQRHKGKQ
jgi:hypothetical protein